MPTEQSIGCPTPEMRFLAEARSGQNSFLTGMAGTGKSTLLRNLISSSIQRIDVTASTGVAALNIGGMTIHRFCGMMVGPQCGETDEEYFKKLRRDPRQFSIRRGFKRIRACAILVVDEVSMLPGRQLQFIDFLFRRIRGCSEPFGGCQVIFVGDFLQLPPVRTSESGPYDWAFLSPAWEAANLKTVILDTVRRQDEVPFVNALSQFRVGSVRGDSAKLLQSRVKNFPSSSLTRLYTHNAQVDKWNDFQLAELPGPESVLEAVQSGPQHEQDFLVRNLLTPSTLRVKPGALVSFTVNKNAPGDAAPLFVNGEIGIVEEVKTDHIRVLVESRGSIEVQPFTWRYNMEDPHSGSFTQYPLRLAWAMTIHKAQGLTLDTAYLDIRAAREPGQAYVAVSRVRTLEGLHFKDWFKGIHVSLKAIQFYEENK